MSWLVAVFMPGVLMVSAFAMQRLESSMHDRRPGAGRVVAVDEPAALGNPGRFDAAHWDDEPGLPTRPNPGFQPSEFAEPV